jgi:hypothetical protein
VFFIAGGLGDICDVPRIPPSGGKCNRNLAYVMPVWDGTEQSMQDLMDGIIYERKAIWAAFAFFSSAEISWPTAVKAGVSLRRPINPALVEAPSGGFPKPRPEIDADLRTLLAAFGCPA